MTTVDPPLPTKRLSPRHRLFCEEYVATGNNGALSARLAGFAAVGARQEAHRLLKRPEIQAEIAVVEEMLMKRVRIDQERIIGQLLEDRRLAIEYKQINAAVRCDQLLGTHIGMFDAALPDSQPLSVLIQELKVLQVSPNSTQPPVLEASVLPDESASADVSNQ